MRFTLAAFLIAFPGAASADDALVDAGRRLFDANCVRCHGKTASQGAAGDIRGLPAATIANALRGIENMPNFVMGEDEIAALAAWLAYLEAR